MSPKKIAKNNIQEEEIMNQTRHEYYKRKVKLFGKYSLPSLSFA